MITVNTIVLFILTSLVLYIILSAIRYNTEKVISKTLSVKLDEINKEINTNKENFNSWLQNVYKYDSNRFNLTTKINRYILVEYFMQKKIQLLKKLFL